MHKVRLIAMALAVVAVSAAGLGWFFVYTKSGQEMALEATVPILFDAQPTASYDGLRVFVCGAGSPLIAPAHAQSCIAVMAGEALYIVDAGMGAAGTFQFAGESLAPLRMVLFTHYHSDHITGLPDVNLNSWVQGRPQPLELLGPTGVERIAAGFNEAFALDYGYRVAHHGAAMLPPDLGPMQARTVAPGEVLARDGLTITAFPVDHGPVAPAFGYRFDYRGRSVVISGDTVVTATLRIAARDADLLLQDGLSLPIISALAEAADAAGADRFAKILNDIQSYHAHVSELGELAASAGVRQLALYHLLPAPRNLLMRQVFHRELPADAVLAQDGMIFELPSGSEDVHILRP